MSLQDKENWIKRNPKGKAFLSWNLADYLANNLEPLPCILQGKTEGEAMNEEEIESWLKETIVALSILKEDYPEKFNDQVQKYILDLEYLASLGKISQEELKELKKEENFNFGQK